MCVPADNWGRVPALPIVQCVACVENVPTSATRTTCPSSSSSTSPSSCSPSSPARARCRCAVCPVSISCGTARCWHSSPPARRTVNHRPSSLLTVTLLLLLLVDPARSCAPGRGHYRRRSPRKLTPLVYKQHVPNVSEQTLGASGLSEGPVDRHDQDRFNKLVPNYSEDVVFRDEEGTGADRMLTQRAKEKLDTLAVSVLNQWPGVRLRVTEAWHDPVSGGLAHRGSSLHYEGRAVDITTSDRDRSKYGMLARLAVEVGFDWVYYESRSHVHCSVKSESVSRHRHGGCFSGDSTVQMSDGSLRRLDQLRQGEWVRSLTPGGSTVDSRVIMWLDRAPRERRLFHRLTTESGRQLTLTPGHLIYVLDADTARANSHVTPDMARATFARHAIIGDFLLTPALNGTKLRAERLVSAELVWQRGVFAPLTEQGTVLVGGVAASCYAQVQHQSLAHWAMWPVRLYSTLRHWLAPLTHTTQPVTKISRTDGASEEPSGGVHWYPWLLYSIADYVLPRTLMYD